MSGIVLKFPIAPGKVEAWRRFCQELSGSRLKTYEASRLRLGITRERLALVETEFGSAVMMTIESADVGNMLAKIFSSVLPFDLWYREQVQEMYGVNLARLEQFLQPAQLPIEQKVHFEWAHASQTK